jgi:hypothetical protein
VNGRSPTWRSTVVSLSEVPVALAPLFAVRAAGVPFDVLEQLGTPAVSARARDVNALANAIDDAAKRALAELPALSPKLRSKIAPKLFRHKAISDEHAAAHPSLAAYAAALVAHAAALVELDAAIEREYEALLGVLAREAGRVLPELVVLESATLLDEVRELERQAGTRHLSSDRKRHRTLAMYMQRVCAKNDTIGRFGPILWGRVEPGEGVTLEARPGIARRVELETWVVVRVIELINADPDVRAEIPPRLHPHGRLEDGKLVRLDEQREIALSAGELELARACDGVRAARAIGDANVLASLAERGVIFWKLSHYARDTSPLASLVADVDGWQDRAVRERWQAQLRPLQALVERFEADERADARRTVLRELAAVFEQMGLTTRATTRVLYAATNPINENCTLESTVTLGAQACDRLVHDAWPWFALWQDSIALASDRVYRRLHELVTAAPRHGGKLIYSSLLHTTRAQKFDLDRDGGLTGIARATWKEIQQRFSDRLASRPDAAAWHLSADDCTFLRREHDLPPAGELALPSLDLLPCARSAADASAGRFDWVIGEVHHAFALLQHSTYWRCPDKPGLHAIIRAVVQRQMVSRDSGNDIPVHVNPEAFVTYGMPYVGTARPKPSWKIVRPADAEVVVDEARRDIRLRAPSGEDLGSLIQTASTAMGMHPFFPFLRAPHAPRLYLGNVVVQRRSWDVDSQALSPERPSGLSGSFLAAIERVRAERDIPRWVYVRPRQGVLDSSAVWRDKDNKPICIDLESIVSLDILERRLRKYEGLVMTEMLPTPDQLFLDSAGGRVLFEIRTNVVPRSLTA